MADIEGIPGGFITQQEAVHHLNEVSTLLIECGVQRERLTAVLDALNRNIATLAQSKKQSAEAILAFAEVAPQHCQTLKEAVEEQRELVDAVIRDVEEAMARGGDL